MRNLLATGVLLLTAAQAFAAGADKNDDGQITRQELTEVHASLFTQLDRNGDGFVTMEEADAHFMEIADFNRDGKVTREENNTYAAEAAAGDLANCDANGDETLSGGEVSCITSADSFE
jgi:EF-hand domain pair